MTKITQRLLRCDILSLTLADNLWCTFMMTINSTSWSTLQISITFDVNVSIFIIAGEDMLTKLKPSMISHLRRKTATLKNLEIPCVNRWQIWILKYVRRTLTEALYIRANFDYLISIIMLEIQSRSFEIIHSMVICN